MVITNHQNVNGSVRRAVIIGLGGTGAEVLMRLRKLMVDHYGSLDRLPIIDFMYVDSDIGWIDRLTKDAEDNVRFTAAQIVDTSITDLDELCSEIEKGNAPEYSWLFYPYLRQVLHIREGVRVNRQLGRLGFWRHQAQIERYLTDLVTRMMPNNCVEYMAREYQQSVDPGIDIHIISSLAGGTGAGMFLDMAFLVRHVIQELDVQGGYQLYGHLVMPQAFGFASSDTSLSIGYAALKELNYYNYHYQEGNPLASLFGEPLWEVDYPSGRPGHIKYKNQMPFDYTYLLSNQNKSKTLDRDQVFTMLATSIFHDCKPGIAAYKRARRFDLAYPLFCNDTLDCPASFMSMGMSTIHLPVRKIQDLLKHILALRAVRQWIDRSCDSVNLQTLLDDERASEPTSLYEQAQSNTVKGSVARYINDTFLPKASFHKKDLLSAVTSNDDKDFKHVVAKLEADIQKRWINENWKPHLFMEHLKSEWEHWQQLFSDDSPDQNQWGDQMKQIVGAQQHAIPLYRKNLYNEAMGGFEDPNRGVAWSLAFLEGMQGYLRMTREYLIAESVSSLKLALITGIIGIIDTPTLNKSVSLSFCILQRTDEELQKLDAVINESKGFKGLFQGTSRIRPQAESFIKWCGIWCKTKAEERSRRLAAETCSILIDDIDNYKEQVRNVAAAMASLDEQLQNKIRDCAREAANTPNVGKLLFNLTFVDEFENKIKWSRGDAYNPEEIGAKALASASISLDKVSSKNVDALLESLLNEAELVIGDLSQYSSARTDFTAHTVLSEQYAGDSDRIRRDLGEVVEMSSPFIRLHVPITGRWAPEGDFPEGLRATRMAGIYGGYEPNDVDIERVAVLKALDGINDWRSDREVQPLHDSEEIVFVQECGGFPLRALTGIDEMKRAYENHRKSSWTDPLHIVPDEIADATFPDIIPPSRNDMERAQRVYHVGTALGMILNRNFQTEDAKAELLSFIRTDSLNGEEEAVALGDKKSSVIIKLAYDTTLAEEIEGSIISSINSSGEADRTAIIEKLKWYLADLKKDIVKAERDPSIDYEYQRASKIVKEFAQTHHLA